MKNDEKKISDFIDRLNEDKKPIDEINESDDVNRLLNAVKQVRSLKEPTMPNENYPNILARNVKEQIGKRPSRNKRRIWKGGLASIAAVLVIAVMMNFISSFNKTNIVYAMEQAFNEVKAYHGILETINVNGNGEETIQGRFEVWADKEGQYYIKGLEGFDKDLVTVNNGEKKWQMIPHQNEVSILPALPDSYRFGFEISREVEEIKNALSSKVIEDDVVIGRPSYILEVTPQGGLPYLVWIDKETKLPLQRQTQMDKGLQYFTRYSEIEFINEIPPELIAYSLPDGFSEIIKDGEEVPNNTEVIDSDAVFNPQIEVQYDLEIEKATQISVDSGSSPWKLDPVYVTQVFVSLEISPDGIVGDYPIDYEDLKVIENTGINAIIEVNSDNAPISRVYLERIVRQGTTGIWTVVGYNK